MFLRKALLTAATSLSPITVAEAQPANEGSIFFDCVTEAEDGTFNAQFSSFARLLDDNGHLHDRAAEIVSSHSEITGPFTFETTSPNVDMLLHTHNNLMTTIAPDVPGYNTLVADNAELVEADAALEESDRAGEATPSCEPEIYLGS